MEKCVCVSCTDRNKVITGVLCNMFLQNSGGGGGCHMKRLLATVDRWDEVVDFIVRVGTRFYATVFISLLKYIYIYIWETLF